MHAHRSLLPSLLVCLAGSMACGQTLRILPPLEGYPHAETVGISSNGRFIVGISWTTYPDPIRQAATLWDQDRKPLELVGIWFPSGVSNDGSVIAGQSWDPDYANAVILTPSGSVDLGDGWATAVNADGSVVVGWLGRGADFRAFGYLTSSGTLISLLPADGDDWSRAEAVNDAGTLIAGITGSLLSHETRACVWNISGGPPVMLLDSPSYGSYARGVSADGSVVIGASHAQAARWADGRLEIIAPDPAGSSADDISDNGTLILGHLEEPYGSWEWGFLYDTTHGLRSLGQILIDAHVDLSDLAPYQYPWRTMSSDGRRIIGNATTGQISRYLALEIILETDCPADFNADFVADFFDYLDFVALYDVQDPRADFNGDQTVDFFDYLDFVAAFEAGCD
jgi:hypothetical protein